MKKFISLLLLLSIVLTIPSNAYADTLLSMAKQLEIEYPDNPGDDENYIYDKLMEAFDNDVLVCALMGNFRKESDMDPRRWEGDDDPDCTKSEPINELVNSDILFPTRESKYYFAMNALVPGHEGFGLAQWTAIGRKIQLYDFAVEQGKSITDLEMQVDFVIWEINNNYPDLIEDADGDTRLDAVVVKVASRYERTHAGEMNMAYRLAWADYYYTKFTGKVFKESK